MWSWARRRPKLYRGVILGTTVSAERHLPAIYEHAKEDPAWRRGPDGGNCNPVVPGAKVRMPPQWEDHAQLPRFENSLSEIEQSWRP
jgi:hypothetical protein